MAITVLSRWSGGKRDTVIALAKKAKVIHEKHGAEWFRMGHIHTGLWTGHTMVSVRYPNWDAYGKAMDKLSQDTAYQKLMAEAGEIAKLEGRTVITSVDL